MTTLLSGSPIIKNGKHVGAVTHELINDPITGYGIFIENMRSAVNVPMSQGRPEKEKAISFQNGLILPLLYFLRYADGEMPTLVLKTFEK